MPTEAPARRKRGPLKTALYWLLIVLLLPWIVLYLTANFVRGLILRLNFRNIAHRDGKFILFVYSDNPRWQSRIEQQLLPLVREHAIVLNWSDRNNWDRSSWAVQAFHHWGDTREFNPLAIVYINLAHVRVFRFFKAFRESRRGRPANLEKLEAEFAQLVNATIRAQSAEHAA